jgi:hypothetical protein
MIVHIDVTQQDIDQGQRCRSRLCPVALAANRALNKTDVQVGMNILFWGVDNDPIIEMPQIAKDRIYTYDMCNPIEP